MALFSTAVIAFFLSPFVVHHLGSVAYGAWVLVNSLVAYMGLLDLGMRGTVVRFLARYHASGEHEESSRVLGAALAFRGLVSGVIIVVGLVGATLITKFHIPPELHHAARLALVLSSLSMATALTGGVFAGVSLALHRWDIVSKISIAQSVLTAAGVVVALETGHSIVAIAAWQLTTTVLSALTQFAAAHRLYPELGYQIRIPRRNLVSELFSYSFFVLLINVNAQVIYYTDTLVVGAFLPVVAVTSYAIGGNLVQYMRDTVSGLATTFMPASASLEANKEQEKLTRLLIEGTAATLLVALPVIVGLFLRGGTFIRLWMGAEYAETSSRVLRVLLIAWIFICANSCSGNISYGLSRHKPAAIWTTAEAIANFALSILLVKRWGLIGVAWGTVIPSLVVNAGIWPLYITRVVGASRAEYLWRGWARPALTVAPFALGCYLADRYWFARNLPAFFGQMACLMVIYVISAVYFFGAYLERYTRVGTWAAVRLRQLLALVKA
jgi:O-antigen/teichoic acid export membrane protein